MKCKNNSIDFYTIHKSCLQHFLKSENIITRCGDKKDEKDIFMFWYMSTGWLKGVT